MYIYAGSITGQAFSKIINTFYIHIILRSLHDVLALELNWDFRVTNYLKLNKLDAVLVLRVAGNLQYGVQSLLCHRLVNIHKAGRVFQNSLEEASCSLSVATKRRFRVTTIYDERRVPQFTVFKLILFFSAAKTGLTSFICVCVTELTRTQKKSPRHFVVFYLELGSKRDAFLSFPLITLRRESNKLGLNCNTADQLAKVTVCSILIASSLARLAYEIHFQLLNFRKTTIYKRLHATLILIFRFIVLFPQ